MLDRREEIPLEIACHQTEGTSTSTAEKQRELY